MGNEHDDEAAGRDQSLFSWAEFKAEESAGPQVRNGNATSLGLSRQERESCNTQRRRWFGYCASKGKPWVVTLRIPWFSAYMPSFLFLEADASLGPEPQTG